MTIRRYLVAPPQGGGGGDGGAVDSVNGQTGVVDLDAADVGAQPADTDLAAIAALTHADNTVLQTVSGAWTARTPAQVKATLALAKADVGLGSVDNTTDLAKPISTLTQTALDAKASTSSVAAVVRGTRAMPPPSRIISRFATGHGWTGGSDDTTVYALGAQSRKGTTNGAGASFYFTSPTFGTAQDWSGSYLRLLVRVLDPTRLSSCQVYIDTGGVQTNNFVATLATNNTAEFIFPTADWVFITVPRAAFTLNAGTPDWTQVTSVRVRFADNAGSAATDVWINAVELLPDQAATYPNGILVVEADDGFAAHKTRVRPVLDVLGVPCTLNPIVERITNTAAGMTVADLRDMQDRSGWQVSGHAFSQTFHDTAGGTTAAAAADFAAAKTWLRSNGFHSGSEDYALCPGTGSQPAAAMRQVIGSFWRSARSSGSFYETIVPADTLQTRALLFSGNTNVQIQANIDAAAAPGGVFVLAVHDVLAGATNGTSGGLAAIAIDNLRTVVEYALGKGMIPRTRDDWLSGR